MPDPITAAAILGVITGKVVDSLVGAGVGKTIDASIKRNLRGIPRKKH